MRLSPEAEEVATFFAKMLEHEYTTKDIFRKNFFKDWRKAQQIPLSLFYWPGLLLCAWLIFFFFFLQEMTSEEKSKITDLKKCDFTEMSEYFKAQSEARKAMSKEQKQVSYVQLAL